MTTRRVVLVSVVCLSIGVFGVRTLSQTRGSSPAESSDAEGRRNKTLEERKREIEKWRKEAELAREQRKRELKKKNAERQRRYAQKAKERAKEGHGPLIDRKEKTERFLKEAAEMKKEFTRQKAALGATEEQWKLIKAKLEKVRQLRGQANSGVGLSLADGSGDSGPRSSVPTWQWKRPWKDKAPDELTEAQRLAKQLVGLVGRNSTTPQAFRSRMAALRKARSEEAECQRQWSEAREELREMLTPRQEAALVLMKWL